jgi:4'-phosphopantetheinyl transferase
MSHVGNMSTIVQLREGRRAGTGDGLRQSAFEFTRNLAGRSLAEKEIHIWHGVVGRASSEEIHDHLGSLSSDEVARAWRFRFERDRNTFIYARAMLRTVIGMYLGTNPDCVRFSYSEYGKPSLEQRREKRGLHFNLSHSHDAVLLAICRNREIGADIEYIREDLSPEEISSQYFSYSEQRNLTKIPTRQSRVKAFFRCWTRKEAWLKARGNGFSYPLKDFDVSVDARPTVTLVTRLDPAEASRWQIFDLSCPAGYAAALAIEREEAML